MSGPFDPREIVEVIKCVLVELFVGRIGLNELIVYVQGSGRLLFDEGEERLEVGVEMVTAEEDAGLNVPVQASIGAVGAAHIDGDLLLMSEGVKLGVKQRPGVGQQNLGLGDFDAHLQTEWISDVHVSADDEALKLRHGLNRSLKRFIRRDPCTGPSKRLALNYELLELFPGLFGTDNRGNFDGHRRAFLADYMQRTVNRIHANCIEGLNKKTAVAGLGLA